jgi:YidC/Oxa1 family membrane protein insertase
MDRRTILAVALSILFMSGYQTYIAKKYPQQSTTQRVTDNSEQIRAIEQAKPYLQADVQAPSFDEPEQIIRLDNETISVAIGSYGASVDEILLFAYLDPERHEPTRLTRPPDMRDRLGRYEAMQINDQAVREPNYQLTRSGNTVTARGILAPGVTITKHYVLTPGGELEQRVDVQNTTDEIMTFGGTLIVSPPLTQLAKDEQRFAKTLLLKQGKVKKATPKAGGNGKKSLIQDDGEHTVAGQVNQYFAILARWERPTSKVSLKRNYVSDDSLQVAASWAPVMIRPGATHTDHLTFYAGSQDYRTIAAVDPDFARLFPQGLLGTLGLVLLSLLRFFYSVSHNYGVAIILLTAAVAVIFVPLSVLQMRMSGPAMAKMRDVQPKVDALRTKYKDNPQKLNKETMALYKKHHVNPIAPMLGCLPMVLQIPIFIALYRVLLNTVDLRGAGFLWITDLAAPDRLFTIGSFPINILPILMAGAMFLQQKFSPMKPAQSANMPDMTKIMTPLFVILFYNWPSGYVMYFLVNTSIMVLMYATVLRAKIT